MELIIKAYLIKNIRNIEELNVKVEPHNYILIRAKLESEYQKIVTYFKTLKRLEIIHSIFIPKNKKIQKKLDSLVKIKKEIKRSVEKINSVFR